MKRDMDLCRKILLDLEATPFGPGLLEVKLDDYDDVEISYHIKLLAEAGLVDAEDLSKPSRLRWRVRSLTWAGHDFLEASRNDTNWNTAKGIMKEKGVGLIFDVLKQLLVEITKGQVLGG